MTYFVYDVISTLVLIASAPFLPLLLCSERVRRGILQRFGHYSKSVALLRASRPIWIHAASVGEVTAAAHLARELKAQLPGRKILLSTFTMTGNAMAGRVSAADAIVFLPLDHLWPVRRAFRQIDPSLLIIVETEIWPNLLREAHRRGVPALLLSGRLSARSLRRYNLFHGFFRHVLGGFRLLGMQSEEDARRIVSLGADAARVRVLGNLKQAVSGRPTESVPEHLPGPLNEKRGLLLVVGSSHPGEEEMLIAVFRALKRSFPTLRMVLAPRHPPRFLEVERLLQNHGVGYQKKSLMNGSCRFESDVLLLDTLGDLEKFYAIADVAFVGGSLVEQGGHNLLEPARFRKPVVFGPHTANFAAVAAAMKRAGAGIEVSGAEDLESALAALLGSEEKRALAGSKAYEIAIEDHQVMEKTMAAAQPYLASIL